MHGVNHLGDWGAQFGKMLSMDAPDTGTSDAGVLGAQGVFDRSDTMVRAALRLEYRATNWLAFMLDTTLIANITDFEFKGQSGSATTDPAEFTDLEVFGGVRVSY